MKRAFLLFLVLLLPSLVLTGRVIHVNSKVYSTKSTCEGLHLSPTNNFEPVTCLTTTIHLDKQFSVLVHYQMTVHTLNKDFYTKLQINYANAGSLVHNGNEITKTVTGFYMVNLNPGYYTIKVLYKSPVDIKIGVNWDWQTAVLQVMWFDDAHTVSDSIICYPTTTTTNNYNNMGPIKDVEVALQIPNDRAIISVYQFSAELASSNYTVTALNVNGFYQKSSVLVKGQYESLLLHGVWADNCRTGIHYINLLYRTPVKFSFTDCVEKYFDNKNLYAMMLPPSCKVQKFSPENFFTSSSSNRWAQTDVTYSLVLSQQSHVIVMYQFAGLGDFVTQLTLNSAKLRHTVAHSSYSGYFGNFGMWQGALGTGTQKLALVYRSSKAHVHHPLTQDWHTRTMTIITC